MTARGKWSLAGCLACALALATLASLAFRDLSVRSLDARAFWSLSSHEGWEGVARVVALLGDPGPQIALLCLLAVVGIRAGRWERTVAALVLVLGANVTTQLLKPVFAITAAERFERYAHLGGHVFPSGHTTAVAAMALAALLVVPRRWLLPAAALGAGATAAVGLAVVVLHRHDPSDVVAGCLVALAWFFAVSAALDLRATMTGGRVRSRARAAEYPPSRPR